MGSVCEPKMAANAEMRPGPQYPLMSLVFGLTRKAHHLQWNHKKAKQTDIAMYKQTQITTLIS